MTTRLLDEDEYESKLGVKDTKLCKLHGHEYTSTRWIKKCAVQGCMALGHTSGLNDGILKCLPHLEEARTRSVTFWQKPRPSDPLPLKDGFISDTLRAERSSSARWEPLWRLSARQGEEAAAQAMPRVVPLWQAARQRPLHEPLRGRASQTPTDLGKE